MVRVGAGRRPAAVKPAMMDQFFSALNIKLREGLSGDAACCAPLLLGLPALAVQFTPGAAERLEYDRARLAAGEVWRLLTCHFTHWTPWHLLWDLLAVAVLAIGCAPFGPRRLGATIAAAAIAVPAAVWVGLPSMT